MPIISASATGTIVPGTIVPGTIVPDSIVEPQHGPVPGNRIEHSRVVVLHPWQSPPVETGPQ